MTPAPAPAHARARRSRARGRRGAGALLLTLALGVSVVATAGPAGAAVTTVTDSFTRTVSGGWGSANAGGAWTVSTPARFAVSGGVGTASLTTDGVTQRATLPGTGTANDVAVTASVSRTPDRLGPVRRRRRTAHRRRSVPGEGPLAGQRHGRRSASCG